MCMYLTTKNDFLNVLIFVLFFYSEFITILFLLSRSGSIFLKWILIRLNQMDPDPQHINNHP